MSQYEEHLTMTSHHGLPLLFVYGVGTADSCMLVFCLRALC